MEGRDEEVAVKGSIREIKVGGVGGGARRSWILSSTCDSERRRCEPSSLTEMMAITLLQRSSNPEMEISLVGRGGGVKYRANRKAGVSCKEKKTGRMGSKRGTAMRCWKRRRFGSGLAERTASTCA